MRTVKCNYWDVETKEWTKDAVGKFHKWAVGYEELYDGVGNYTYAIIELLSGKIVAAMPEDVTFLTEETP